MSITDRDKKILMLLIPIALVAAYWFLLLAPKREEAASVQQKLAKAQTEQQTAESQASSLSGAKQGFASDYTTVIRLGKAIPSTVDMPSLLVQLDRATRGTNIAFDKIEAGDRQAAPTAAAAPAGTAAPASGNTSNAQSAPGKTAQNANAGVKGANATNQANANAAGGTGAASSTGSAPGLETVPLTFEFHGTFFDLADFFHRMKRFVRVANNDVVVRGRLMTIDEFSFKAGDTFPNITADVSATVYLAPKAQGVSAGATPSGPAGAATPATSATPATPAVAPAPAQSSSPATSAPAATVK